MAFAFFAVGAIDSGESLQTTRMFSSLSLMILFGQPLFWMFEAVLDIMAAAGCFKRIENFLSTTSKAYGADGTVASSQQYDNGSRGSTARLSPHIPGIIELEDMVPGQHASSEPKGVQVENAGFKWSSEGAMVLKDVSLMVKPQELAIVVGSVASGKTTLLKGLLGEVPHITGKISIVRHRLSWCEQTPWLINDTVRKNIIGFSRYDEELYRIVMLACDLDKDRASLKDGDLTVIGSNGIALSGGQKQRVALARAIYSRPQLALFDDPFSGLDNHTARVVFDRIFSKGTGLLRKWGTTVILATQSINLLPYSDRVIVVKDGVIAEQGDFTSLNSTGSYVVSLDRHYDSEAGSSDDAGPGEASVEPRRDREARPRTPKPDQAQTEDKRRQRGDSAVYGFFLRAIGVPFAVGLLVSEIAWAFLSTFSSVWLNFWSKANSEHPKQRISYYLGIYTALQGLGVVSFGLILMVMFGMLFVARDIGEITTRFSQDIGIIDRSLEAQPGAASAVLVGSGSPAARGRWRDRAPRRGDEQRRRRDGRTGAKGCA